MYLFIESQDLLLRLVTAANIQHIPEESQYKFLSEHRDAWLKKKKRILQKGEEEDVLLSLVLKHDSHTGVSAGKAQTKVKM